MAKNQKKNKNKKTSKQKVSMRLIQNMILGHEPSDSEKEKIYQNFRTRAFNKSDFRYRDLGGTPELLRLHFIGSMFDSTQELLVEIGSFAPIMGEDEHHDPQEIGFEIYLKSPLTPNKTHRLEVLRKQHKSTLYITL